MLSVTSLSSRTVFQDVTVDSIEWKTVQEILAKIGCSIVKLESIFNPVQEQVYEGMRKALSVEIRREDDKKGGLNEHLWLFHGTSDIYGIDGIARSGFDNRYFSLSGKFGAGIYLADELAKSHQYTRKVPEAGNNRVVFVCKALLGKCEELQKKGDRKPRAGPSRGFQSIHWIGFQKQGKKWAKPGDSGFYDEYILYRYGQAIPWLKITYHEDEGNGVEMGRRAKTVAEKLHVTPSMLKKRMRVLEQVINLYGESDSVCREILQGLKMTLVKGIEALDVIEAFDFAVGKYERIFDQFGAELVSDAALFEKWKAATEQSRTSRRLSEVWKTKARMTRLHDMMESVRSFCDELVQIVQQHRVPDRLAEAESGYLLRSVRRGIFVNYAVIKNVSAKLYWMEQFPGRPSVPWGEFRNTLLGQSFMEMVDDLERTRACFWLKANLDKNADNIISIEEWNEFVGDSQKSFQDLIIALFTKPMTDEDDIDWISTKAQGKGVVLIEDSLKDVKSCNPLFSSAGIENVTSLAEKLGISSKSIPSGQIWSFDICFLVDCTGTMKDYISELLNLIPRVVRGMKIKYAGAAVRLAFVGYRDIGDEQPFVILPFTERVEDVLVYIMGNATAEGGGGDAAEDVIGGLEAAVQLEWMWGSKAVRLLLHLGDAPSHGTLYHAFSERTKAPSWTDARDQWDRFPDTDKDGRKGERLMNVLAKMQVDYSFFQLLPFTERMTRRFMQWYNNCSEKIRPMNVILCNLQTLYDVVSSEIDKSYSGVVSLARLSAWGVDQVCEHFRFLGADDAVIQNIRNGHIDGRALAKMTGEDLRQVLKVSFGVKAKHEAFVNGQK